MIIRPVRADEYNYLAQLWLETSLRAHPFLPPDEQQRQALAMRSDYLPHSETWVITGDNPAVPPLGFISLIGRHIAALFIHPGHQGRGLGSRLLEHAKSRHSSLTLNVYSRNADAIHFYEYHGFCTTSYGTVPHSAANEQKMMWKRDDSPFL